MFIRAFGLLVVVAMIAYVATRRSLVESLLDVSPLSIVLLLILSIANIAAQSFQFREISVIFGLQLRPREWVGLTAVNTMANYSLPARSGLVVRAGFLARVHGMSLSSYAALAAVSLGLMLVIAAAAGFVISLAVLEGDALTRAVVFFLSVFGVLVAGVIVIKLLLAFARLPQRVAGFVEGFGRGIVTVAASGSGAVRFVAWTAAVFVIQSLRIAVAFRATGVAVPVSEAFIIASAGAFAIVVSITPGGLGIKEGTIAFMAGLVGIGVPEALLAALIDRAAEVLVTFAVGAWLARPLLQDAYSKPDHTRSTNEADGRSPT